MICVFDFEGEEGKEGKGEGLSRERRQFARVLLYTYHVSTQVGRQLVGKCFGKQSFTRVT